MLARKTLPDATIKVLRRSAAQVDPDLADGALASLEDVIAFEPTIAVVASPATAHVEALRLLFRLGTHVLVEKPVAASTLAAQPLLQEVKQSDGICLVGYNMRFTESVQLLRDELTKGTIGAPWAVRCEVGQWLPDWRPKADYRTTVTAQRSLGGGVLLELSHEFDYLAWLFGTPEWVIAHTSRQSALKIDVEDSAQILFGGSLGSESQNLAGTLSMDLLRRDKTRHCSVIGEKGTLRWDAVLGSVEIFESEAGGWRTLLHRPDDVTNSYVEQWLHFLDCVSDRAAPLITIEDGYRTLLLVDACRKSSADGRKVLIGASGPEGLRDP